MNNKELKKILLDNFGIKLSTLGFDEKAKWQSFVRAFHEGREVVHLSFITLTYDKGFDVTIDIAIRFENVEKLINWDSDLLTEKEKKGSYTIWTILRYLSRKRLCKYSIYSEKDIWSVVDSLFEDYCELWEPFFNKYRLIKNVHALFSDMNNKEAWRYSTTHSNRAKKSIAIAYLLNQANIEEQISGWLIFLRDKEELGINDFIAFSKRLNK